ncbi:hypothetical protein MASR1M8_14670 [Thermomonas brevis]
MPNGSKLWRLRYYRPGTKARTNLSLGALTDVSLRRAREKRAEARALLADGIDPGAKRQAESAAREAAATNSLEAHERRTNQAHVGLTYSNRTITLRACTRSSCIRGSRHGWQASQTI